MALNQLDIELLYLMAEEKNPVSTWTLVKKIIKSKNRDSSTALDAHIRYRLKRLSQIGLVKKTPVSKASKTVFHYSPSAKTVCHNGSLFLFTNPLIIVACKHIDECPSTCRPVIFTRKHKIYVKGCKLLREAPQEIKQLVYSHFEQQTPQNL